MKGNKVVLLIVVIVVIAMAAVVGSMTMYFNNNKTQKGHALTTEGTVVQKEGPRILVISGKDKSELKGRTQEEMLEGAEEAIWFSLSMDQSKSIKEFDNVRIKYSQVDESFPAQASANSIEVLSDEMTE